MADIAKSWNPDTLSADLAIAGAAFTESASLQSAVVNSLFSDARAPAELLAYMADRDGVTVAEVDPRGWYGDSYASQAPGQTTGGGEPDRFGSLLWTLQREKQTTETLNRARDYATDALAWMMTDGIARDIAVSAEWVRRGVLGLGVVIELADGRRRDLHFNTALIEA